MSGQQSVIYFTEISMYTLTIYEMHSYNHIILKREREGGGRDGDRQTETEK